MNRIKAHELVVPELDEIQKKAGNNDITTIKMIAELCYYDWVKEKFIKKFFIFSEVVR